MAPFLPVLLLLLGLLALVGANRPGDPRTNLCGHATVFDGDAKMYVSMTRTGECTFVSYNKAIHHPG
jgi:hypothetical protein